MRARAILVIQTAFVGDVVLTTPLLHAAKASAPSARVVVLATPAGANLLEGSPFADAVVPFRKRGRGGTPLGMVRVIRSLRRERFDAVLAAQRSFRSGLVAYASGAPVRIGFEGAAGSWAYTNRVSWDAERHAVRRYLALAGPLGIDPEAADPAPHLAPPAGARERADALLRGEGIVPGDRLLAVAPGSVWGTKRWTPEGYARVVAESEGRLGLRPFLVGSEDERALCEEVSERAGGSVPDFAGRSDLSVLAALLARAAALLTNDSGPGHVASAVGTPVVAVFGPTVPAFGYAPYGDGNRIVEHGGLDCRPCHRHGPAVCPLGHHRCMTEIGPEAVLAALAGQVRRG
jgi:heptosyltransferase-2